MTDAIYFDPDSPDNQTCKKLFPALVCQVQTINNVWIKNGATSLWNIIWIY